MYITITSKTVRLILKNVYPLRRRVTYSMWSLSDRRSSFLLVRVLTNRVSESGLSEYQSGIWYWFIPAFFITAFLLRLKDGTGLLRLKKYCGFYFFLVYFQQVSYIDLRDLFCWKYYCGFRIIGWLDCCGNNDRRARKTLRDSDRVLYWKGKPNLLWILPWSWISPTLIINFPTLSTALRGPVWMKIRCTLWPLIQSFYHSSGIILRLTKI